MGVDVSGTWLEPANPRVPVRHAIKIRDSHLDIVRHFVSEVQFALFAGSRATSTAGCTVSEVMG